MKKIVFITGVNGFIGRNLCKYLTDRKHIVYGIDNFFSSKKTDLVYLNCKNFFFKEHSILNKDIFNFVDKNIDAVIHLAAQTSVIRSLEEPKINQQINVDGFENIINQCKKRNVKKLIFASSSAVYGDNRNLPLKESLKNLKPLSPYAISKLENEKIAQSNSNDIDFIGLRLFNMYGKTIGSKTSSNYAPVISKWIDNFRNQKQCEIFGDGKSMRDFCFIDDLCEFFELLLDNNKTYGIYNYCTNKPYSIKTLFFKIFDIFNSKKFFEIKFDKPVYLNEKPGEIKLSYGDNTLIERDFSYKPKTFLEQGLKKIIL